ncbi:MAG: DUF4153 domain-containing protein [Lachnospiraceae bacterium]|nr:DUF4153 domain-containing protein [Lachnospiraceae bacterium]
MDKKLRFIDKFKLLASKIIDVFREYPVTMLCIVLAALGGAILVPVRDKDLTLRLEKAIAFCLLTAMQTLTFEEIFPEKKPIRFSGYGVSAMISAISVYILTYEEKLFLGMDHNIVSENLVKILLVYGVIMVGFSIHHMFSRLEEDFEVYATKSFLELLKATVVYGLFALGLALIIWVFNELIFDTDDFLEMVEIFLAGGIYTPMCLKAISSKHDEPGKFSRFCILYVLQPMQLLAFAIIYLYIIKIFVTRDDPSNKIFLILACLFSVGMPIWSLVHGLKQNKGILGKISTFLPYAFIPFLFLQIWSIGVRINAYGMTIDRYVCVVLVILEIIYLALYAFQHVTKKQAISWCIYVLMFVAFFGFLCPGTSFDDTVIRSQMKRITKVLDSGNISKAEESTVKSAYNAINRIGYKGERALKNKLTEAQIDKIKKFDEYGEILQTRVYLSCNGSFTNIDISEYQRLYRADYYSSKPENGIVNLQVSFENGQNKQTVRMDMTEYFNWVMDTFDEKYDPQFSEMTQHLFHVSDKLDFYAYNISIDFNLETREVTTFHVDGYLLEK